MTYPYDIDFFYTGKQFRTQSSIMDVKEQQREKDRDRYVRMTNEKYEEKLKKHREAYQRNKIVRNSTQLQKKNTHKGGRNM